MTIYINEIAGTNNYRIWNLDGLNIIVNRLGEVAEYLRQSVWTKIVTDEITRSLLQVAYGI